MLFYFLKYSPKNSDFVRVFFTEIGTSCQQKVNNAFFPFPHPSHKSDYIPQKKCVARLDRNHLDLLDLPKDSYIIKLIELTNNSDDCLTWYRSTLTSRPKSLQGCPTGKLVT